MSIIKEFKEFAVRGNAVDMAVGIIIGAAFSKIVSSLVNDVVMPPIGALLGGVDFSSLKLVVKSATETQKAVTINYGLFINQIIDFSIIAVAVFILVKGVNLLAHTKKAEKMKKCPECFLDIPKEALKCGHCTSKID